MKYTFQFEAGEKLVLETRASESLRHIVQKIVAYLLFLDRTPRIELRVSPDKRDYRPDVVAFDTQGEISLWVDCGQIAVRKVDDLTRLYPRTDLVIVKIDRREMERFAHETYRRVRRTDCLTLLAFDDGFLRDLADVLGHVNVISAHYTESQLDLTLNGRLFTTTVWRWNPDTQQAVLYRHEG